VVSEKGSVEMGTKLRHMILENLTALRTTFRAADPKGSGVLSMAQFRAALFRIAGVPVNATGVVGSKFHQKHANKVEYDRWLRDFLRTAAPYNPVTSVQETEQAATHDALHRLVIANYSHLLGVLSMHDMRKDGRVPMEVFKTALYQELGAHPSSVEALFRQIPFHVRGEVMYSSWLKEFVKDAYSGASDFQRWFVPCGPSLGIERALGLNYALQAPQSADAEPNTGAATQPSSSTPAEPVAAAAAEPSSSSPAEPAATAAEPAAATEAAATFPHSQLRASVLAGLPPPPPPGFAPDMWAAQQSRFQVSQEARALKERADALPGYKPVTPQGAAYQQDVLRAKELEMLRAFDQQLLRDREVAQSTFPAPAAQFGRGPLTSVAPGRAPLSGRMGGHFIVG